MKNILLYFVISAFTLSSFPSSATILYSNIEDDFQSNLTNFVGLVPFVSAPGNPVEFLNVVIAFPFTPEKSGLVQSVDVPISGPGLPWVASFGIFEGLNPLELFTFAPSVGTAAELQILSATLSGAARLEGGTEYFMVGLGALDAGTGAPVAANWQASSQPDPSLRLLSIDGGLNFTAGIVTTAAGFRVNGNVIPIPATIALFGLGLVLLGWSRRGR